MPVKNDTSNNANAGSAANAFEVKVTDPIEGGKEVMAMHGTNVPTFENRVSQEAGSH